jgi:hypothetical protein
MQNGVDTKHHSVESAHESKSTPLDLTQSEIDRNKENQSIHPGFSVEAQG